MPWPVHDLAIRASKLPAAGGTATSSLLQDILPIKGVRTPAQLSECAIATTREGITPGARSLAPNALSHP